MSPQWPHLPGIGWRSFRKRRSSSKAFPCSTPTPAAASCPRNLISTELDAVSFTKGCYPGQEIIARLRYRGAVKRHLCHATTDNSALLAPGAALVPEGEERNIGTVINSALSEEGQELLLVLELPFIGSGQVVVEDFPASPIKSITERTENG